MYSDIADFIESAPPSKELHKWEQSAIEVEHVVGVLTVENQMVLDPFMGSAITSDSDFLPEYALKKKCRWSMNSKQGTRYIKNRMGNDLKHTILVHNGIIPPGGTKRKIISFKLPSL